MKHNRAESRPQTSDKSLKRSLYLCIISLAVSCFASPQFARAQYVESFETWTASSADTWETQDLSGSPFSIPGNAVVEIAIRNASTSQSRFGGVRAVGSSLERRFDLHVAAGGGVDVVIMQVQTDASSQIQHYAENTTDVDFVLLGYWECGTYVERFDIFNGTNAWQDEDLNSYGVSAGNVVEIVMTNESTSQSYDAGVRINGSTLERRVLLQDIDDGVEAITMFVQADNSGSATIETYAGNPSLVDFYLVGYWSAAPGNYTETFADIGSPSSDATWEDVDLTGSGAADGSIVEILFANDIDTSENELGVRENGSSVARILDLREENDATGDGDFGRMHALSDGSAIIDFRHEDVSDAHTFHMLGYWEGGAVLSDHDAGQESNAYTSSGGETDAELFAFEMTPCSGTVTVTEVIFRLTNITGLVDGDWAGVELLVDDNDNGVIDGGETTSVGGSGSVNTAAGTITFSSSFAVTGGTHYILRADFASLSLSDEVTIGLAASDITTGGLVTGSTSSVTHTEQCYSESFQTWTASSADTWETQSLAGSPYDVPGNAIVEIAIRNDNANFPRWGGVRAVGSSLERRRQLQEAEAGGYDILFMHVQTNASSQIQHYSEVIADVDFVLLGYWACGTYVETFDTFTAGASASWEDRDLCTYGVGPQYVAEIVMTNDNATNEREAGARTNGSILERRLDLHEAENGGVDTATMFVQADATLSTTIELYAEADADVDFFLVGYWSVAPLAFNELFVDVGSPGSDTTWEDLDLTSDGVADRAIVEFVLSNDLGTEENEMGVRANGGSASRLLDLHEPEEGGADLGRMHVQADDTATIEFYHEDVSDAHTFRVTGYWDACDAAVEYVVSDLGAVTAANDSLGWSITSDNKVAGFEEDGSGDPDAWHLSCGSFTSLGVLGGSDAEAHDINDNEMVVGWSDDGSGNRRAYTWTSGGGMTSLGTTQGRPDSEALAVNDNSEVVGSVLDLNGEPEERLAFIYLPSPAYTLGAGMTSLGTLGGTESVAMDINDSGQVVGGARNGSDNMRPFRWQNGTMTDLGTLGGDSGTVDHRAETINTLGDVAGRSYTAGGDAHAFFWDGSMVDIGVLTGGTTSWAYGLNDSNVVVGTSNVSGGAFHAFIWDSTNGIRDLNDLIDAGSGWTLIRATDINNGGEITGWGTNGSGDYRAFMLTETCSASGGGAVASIAQSVVTEGEQFSGNTGVIEELVVDPQGQVLGEFVVETARRETFEYRVTEWVDIKEGPGPGRGTLSGFVDSVALPRALSVKSGARPETFKITVYFSTTLDELEDYGLQPAEAGLYSFDTVQATWKAAGVERGEIPPTGVIGDCGYLIHADRRVDYWAIRSKTGMFAVGQATQIVNPEPSEPAGPVEPTPPFEIPGPMPCGVGMILPMFVIGVGWLVGRGRFISTVCVRSAVVRADRRAGR